MSLLQKTLLVSFLGHVLIIIIFALALPSRIFKFYQVPVELAFLEKPPEKIGGRGTFPLSAGERKGNSLVKVYIPQPYLRKYYGPVGLQPGTPPARNPGEGLPVLPSAGRTGAFLPVFAPEAVTGRSGSAGNAFGLTGPGSSRRVLYSPVPHYPEWARARGVEAYLELKLWIEESGSVRDVFILKSSGYPDLDRICLNTVSRWRFEPQPGQPTWAILPLRFRLV